MKNRKKYTVGALCAGYGGIELGLQRILNPETTWVSDFEDIPNRILEQRFHESRSEKPVPNYGDLTLIESPPAVDIVTAGFPCQPVSVGGRRKGIEDERWLIEDVCRVAREAQARWLVLENVRGIFSANQGEALRRVWDALIDNGYSRFEWGVFRSSDVHAPHQRERWFCLATNTHAESLDLSSSSPPPNDMLRTLIANQTPSYVLEVARENNPWRFYDEQRALWDDDEPKPKKWDVEGCSDGTGALYDYTELRGKPNHPKGFKTLPTPTAREYKDAGPKVNFARIASKRGLTGVIMAELCHKGRFKGWGEYAIAIEGWSEVIDRSAPSPLHEDKFGYLAPAFVEWMMGLPIGWVTDGDIGLHRTEALKALGNGVVPHQASFAIEKLHRRMDERLNTLEPEERKMRHLLDLRQRGLTWEEIAQREGYAGHSGPRTFVKRRSSTFTERPDLADMYQMV